MMIHYSKDKPVINAWEARHKSCESKAVKKLCRMLSLKIEKAAKARKTRVDMSTKNYDDDTVKSAMAYMREKGYQVYNYGVEDGLAKKEQKIVVEWDYPQRY